MDRCISVEMAIKHLLEKAAAKFPASFYLGLFAAADELKKLPAADVRPVVRGEWIVRCEYHLDAVTGESDEEFYLECSVCHRKVWDVSQDALIMGDHKRAVKDYPFCHCGADMTSLENGHKGAK